VYERNWKHFDQNLFNDEFANTNWNDILNLDLNDCNYSLESLLEAINKLLDTQEKIPDLRVRN